MKPIIRSILISFTVLLFILSPAPCRAENDPVEHNFNKMVNEDKPATLAFSNSNETGITTFVTYTCSSGAKFWYGTETGNDIAIFLVSSESQVVTTLIQNLDSMVIYYSSSSTQKRLSVAISPNGLDSWVDLEVNQIKGSEAKSVKLPSAGDYCVRIRKNVDNMYIKEIEYHFLDSLSGCPNCFIYRPE